MTCTKLRDPFLIPYTSSKAPTPKPTTRPTPKTLEYPPNTPTYRTCLPVKKQDARHTPSTTPPARHPSYPGVSRCHHRCWPRLSISIVVIRIGHYAMCFSRLKRRWVSSKPQPRSSTEGSRHSPIPLQSRISICPKRRLRLYIRRASRSKFGKRPLERLPTRIRNRSRGGGRKRGVRDRPRIRFRVLGPAFFARVRGVIVFVASVRTFVAFVASREDKDLVVV